VQILNNNAIYRSVYANYTKLAEICEKFNFAENTEARFEQSKISRLKKKQSKYQLNLIS